MTGAETVVLDSWALLAWIRKEPSAERILNLLQSAKRGEIPVPLLSWINAGEVYYTLFRKHGDSAAEKFWTHLPSMPVQLVGTAKSDVLAAARLKSRYRLSYADAFAVGLALDHGATIWTGDPEILALGDLVRVEWLGAPR